MRCIFPAVSHLLHSPDEVRADVQLSENLCLGTLLFSLRHNPHGVLLRHRFGETVGLHPSFARLGNFRTNSDCARLIERWFAPPGGTAKQPADRPPGPSGRAVRGMRSRKHAVRKAANGGQTRRSRSERPPQSARPTVKKGLSDTIVDSPFLFVLLVGNFSE